MQVWRNKTEKICIAESSGKWRSHAAARAPSAKVKGCNESDALDATPFTRGLLTLSQESRARVAWTLDVAAVRRVGGEIGAGTTCRCRHNLCTGGSGSLPKQRPLRPLSQGRGI